jgi:hypothetical protein
MFEYASDVSATGDMKNIGIVPIPELSRWLERHSNKSYTTPDG